MKDQRYPFITTRKYDFLDKRGKKRIRTVIETLLKRIITVAWFFNVLEKFD